MHRYDFVKTRVGGLTLNIGCGNEPLNLEGERPGNVVQFDMDAWNLPNAVQGDAHHLPFVDRAFDVVVMADVIEHLVDPLVALKEAYRVGNKLVASIFQEWILGPGLHQIRRTRKLHREKTGFSDASEVLTEYKKKGDVVRVVPEKKYSHLLHINQFDWPTLERIIRQAGWVIKWGYASLDGIHEGKTLSSWLVEATK